MNEQVEQKPIEEGIPLAIETFLQHGIKAGIAIHKMPTRAETVSDFAVLVWMSGELTHRATTLSFDFFVPVPVLTHRDKNNWAWVIAHGFVGKGFSAISEQSGKEAIAFWEKGLDVVDELIHKS